MQDLVSLEHGYAAENIADGSCFAGDDNCLVIVIVVISPPAAARRRGFALVVIAVGHDDRTRSPNDGASRRFGEAGRRGKGSRESGGGHHIHGNRSTKEN